MAELSNAEQLLYSTIHIESRGSSGSFHGTGFFYQSSLNQGKTDVLITNKHVIEGCAEIVVRCHQADGDGKKPLGHCFNLVIGLDPGGTAYHPDPEVDLCAIAAPIQAYARKQGLEAFYVPLHSGLLLSDDDWTNLDAYEEVLMIGCPNGLYDESNNVPIFRRGITASHPAMRYNGQQEFMIDAACFPGSSGSPVMLYDGLGHLDKKSGNYMLGHKRIKLLGILYAGPTIDQEGEVILAKNRPISVATMMHLGYVMRSSRITELEEELARMVNLQLAKASAM